MAHHRRADLDEFLAQAGRRPRLRRINDHPASKLDELLSRRWQRDNVDAAAA
jgi:hypothetical protein